MPNDPRGKDEFEYEKKRPQNKFKTVGSEEELGDMHLSTENYSVALEYYERALQKIHVSPLPADLLRIYRKISDCYSKKGLLREAMTFLQSAESHCDETDAFGKGTIACRRGIVLYEQGEIDRALHEACASYRLLRTSDEHREVANAQLLIANCYTRLGKKDEAEQFFLDALASYRRIDDPVGESYVLNNLGLFHKNACRFGRALHFLAKALEISEEMGLTQHRVRVTLNLGITHLKARDFRQAVSAFDSARKMSRSTGDDLKFARASLMLGLAEARSGDFGAAEKHLLEARVIAERRGYGREIALADEYLGDLMAGRGDLAGALENYSTALARAKKMSLEGDVVAEVLRRETEIFVAQRKSAEALAVGARALEVAAKCGEMFEIGFIRRAMGLANALLGKEAEAEASINASIAAFREANNPYEAFRSTVSYSEHLVAQGGNGSLLRARKLMNDAVSFFERQEEYRDTAECHMLLAKIERGLKNRDECLLHMFEAQRLCEELGDRNLLRKLRRMRRSIEEEVVGAMSATGGVTGISEELSQAFSRNPHLMTFLDRLLGDLMNKLTVGHGFVALYRDADGNRKITVLARRGIAEAASRDLTEWFMNRDEGEPYEGALFTDIPHDKRTERIRGMLPVGGGSVYFHPLCKGREPFGLLFFQSEGDGAAPPRLAQALDTVATYAGFVGFLVQGSLARGGDGRKGQGKGADDFRQVITRNERMLRILNLAEKVAHSDSSVLLMGETGTGKGLIAQAIHALSPRREKKFVHVNCAALPESLLESELFGHAKGSFTGAIGDKKGLLSEADGGTVFLDEIGKASLAIQGKLLQFLDTRRVRPVGSNEMIGVDVRLIFASKTDLVAMCREGTMLEDFYYRINDFPITIPALRERVEDVHLLAEYYLKTFAEMMGKRVRGFSDEALSLLAGYEWPGNVRELEKTIKRAIILADDDAVITPAEIKFDNIDDASAARSIRSLPERVQDLEKRIISECLIRNGWNRSLAAAELGISYPTILKKIRDYDLTAGY
jgi:transcriptional regulator with GAF, ATPase, and Fis domain/tetratricopeptide (TPR) repeat protein